jgi:hypothetical protein
MRKLNLRPDDLAVESFDTADAHEVRGTVDAHGDSADCSYGSPGYTACRLSCAYPCGDSEECTPACPNGGTGGTGGTGGGTWEQSCNTSCKLSCAYPC